MTKVKTEYEEIKEIKDDLDSLKSNVVALTMHLQENGIQKARDLSDGIQDTAFSTANRIIAEGEREIHAFEKQVKTNPGTSLLLAFGAGILVNALLSRR